MRLVTKKDLAEMYPCFGLGGINKQIFRANYNGLHKFGAIIKCGRKVLIDLDRYLQWLDSMRIKSGSASG